MKLTDLFYAAFALRKVYIWTVLMFLQNNKSFATFILLFVMIVFAKISGQLMNYLLKNLLTCRIVGFVIRFLRQKLN